MKSRTQRWGFNPVADEDADPVMVPRNNKPLVSTLPERTRRLRTHLVSALRDLRAMKDPERSASGRRREPDGFAASVVRTACSLCKGWCCRNGADDAFLDGRTMARVRRERPELDARAILRLYAERVPMVVYDRSCIFHGERGCALDRSLRSDVCNSYFCGGLDAYLKIGDQTAPVMVIAGEGQEMRISPTMTP